MTLKAFAAKYKIPLNLAVESSKTVEHKPTLERDVDYLERDLYQSMMQILAHRFDAAYKKATDISKRQREVKKIAEESGILS